MQRESRDTQGKIGNQQALLGQLLSQHYLHGQQDPFKILLNQQDPNQLARQLHYYAYLSRARADLIESLRSNLAQSRKLAQLPGKKSPNWSRSNRAGKPEKLSWKRTSKRAKPCWSASTSKSTSQRHEIGRLQRDEKRLTQLIERLARLAKPKKKQSVAATQPAANPRPNHPAARFHQLKGKLHLPVHGELANRFGSQREDSGAIWKGLFIRGRGTGRQMHRQGRVVFADWLRGFGNLIIIDHGNGYMSLYGNNETLYKQVGETVRAAMPVAAVGNSGGNPETGLYFELRHQSRPFDPLGWVKLN